MDRLDKTSTQTIFTMTFDEFIALMSPFGMTKMPIHIAVNFYEKKVEFHMAIEAAPE